MAGRLADEASFRPSCLALTITIGRELTEFLDILRVAR
jgi:hypothetical protein